jgi:hypothetical protein
MCGRCFEPPKADFEGFLERRNGHVHFANKGIGRKGRFRDTAAHEVGPDRHRPERRRFAEGHCHARWNRMLERTCKLAEARRWIPMNPLEAHHMRVNDAKLSAQKSRQQNARGDQGLTAAQATEQGPRFCTGIERLRALMPTVPGTLQAPLACGVVDDGRPRRIVPHSKVNAIPSRSSARSTLISTA